MRNTVPPQHPPRRTFGYLIDPRFQLKYTGLLVGIVLSLMIVLGAVIQRTASNASEYARIAVAEAERAMNESQANSRLARQNMVLAAPDNAILAGVMDEEIAAADAKAAKDLAAVQARRGDIDRQRQTMTLLLVGAALALAAMLSL